MYLLKEGNVQNKNYQKFKYFIISPFQYFFHIEESDNKPQISIKLSNLEFFNKTWNRFVYPHNNLSA